MWKALQSGLSAIAGTVEPEYGPDAIHPVANTFRTTTAEDLCFTAPPHTNVETMVFYFSTDTHAGFFQILHSNVMGLQVTAHMNFKIFDLNKETGLAGDEMIWKSIKLEDFEIVNGHDFKAQNLIVELQNDNSYYIKCSVEPESNIELRYTKVGDGVIFGDNGTTLYGEDINEPWGCMRHVFWPRCTIEGNIDLLKPTTNEESENDDEIIYKSDRKIEINGLGMYVMALQGMKPHHAAATWDFLNYQSVNYSAVIMEFTTPPSYGTTKVSVGMVVNSNGEIIIATRDIDTKHLQNEHDEISGWEIPKAISYDFGNGKVQINGELNNLIERVDVMAEIPQFVKNIAFVASGSKPYIYQFGNWFELEEGSNKETGWAYSESTFISAI